MLILRPFESSAASTVRPSTSPPCRSGRGTSATGKTIKGTLFQSMTPRRLPLTRISTPASRLITPMSLSPASNSWGVMARIPTSSARRTRGWQIRSRQNGCNFCPSQTYPGRSTTTGCRHQFQTPSWRRPTTGFSPWITITMRITTSKGWYGIRVRPLNSSPCFRCNSRKKPSRRLSIPSWTGSTGTTRSVQRF